MAKFLCVCDQVLQTSGEIPNPIQWLAWPGAAFEGPFRGTVDAEDIYRSATLCFKCPRSGHLWFFWEGMENPPTCHEPIDPVTAPGHSNGWKLMSDEEFDDVQGAVEGATVAASSRSMHRSAGADQLWIFWDGPNQPASFYAALPTGWDPLGQDAQGHAASSGEPRGGKATHR